MDYKVVVTRAAEEDLERLLCGGQVSVIIIYGRYVRWIIEK